MCAVSGGSDSTALLRALLELRFDVVVAHVDHGVRPESGDEARRVEALADRLGVPFHGLICQPESASEDALRRARYAALETVDGDRLATGHTADDQAETVLLRMLRGAGTAGIAGIPVRRGRIIRPALDVRRADVLRFLSDLGQAFLEDPSNAALDPLRNRVRHVLLPLLEADFQPNAVGALVRLAESARSDRAFLEAAAADHLVEHGLAVDALLAVHPGLRPHIFRAACDVPISAERMSNITRLLEGDGGAVQLEGGVTVRIDKPRSKGLPKPSPCIVFINAANEGREDAF